MSWKHLTFETGTIAIETSESHAMVESGRMSIHADAFKANVHESGTNLDIHDGDTYVGSIHVQDSDRADVIGFIQSHGLECEVKDFR